MNDDLDIYHYEDARAYARLLEISYPQGEKTDRERAWLDSLERGELPREGPDAGRPHESP